ncbi:hypothetical protein PTKIN_Ptkin03bG0105100 [Pterospermum kingtungense]
MCSSLKQLNTNTNTTSSSEETKTMDCLTGVIGSEYTFSVLLEFAADNDVEGFQRSINDVSLVEVDVNLSCGADKSTPLHFAASGGSIRAAEVVKLLLLASADPCITDANGHYPFDVIVAPWNIPQIRVALGELLNKDGPVSLEGSRESTLSFDSGSSSLSPSLGRGSSSLVSNAKISVVTLFTALMSFVCFHLRSSLVPELIPMLGQSVLLFIQMKMLEEEIQESFIIVAFHVLIFVREPVSAGIYANMLMVFLNLGCTLPNTELECARMVQLALVMFASLPNRPEELRPLYVSFGSGIQSRQSAASVVTTMDNAAAMILLPDSPTALSAMSMLSPFSPAMSPSANVVSQAPMVWPQHVPPLHLPRSNLQGSRLRSSLNARDMPAIEPNTSKDFVMHQQQHLNNLSCLSEPHLATKSPNLDELFSTENFTLEYGTFFYNFEQQQQSFCSLSPRELGYNLSTNLESKGVVGFPVNTWSKWETLNGKVEWPTQENELGQYCKACSTGHHGVDCGACSFIGSLTGNGVSIICSDHSCSLKHYSFC